jgi:hypothetical protein
MLMLWGLLLSELFGELGHPDNFRVADHQDTILNQFKAGTHIGVAAIWRRF